MFRIGAAQIARSKREAEARHAGRRRDRPPDRALSRRRGPRRPASPDGIRLLAGLFGLIDEIAHASLERRRARGLVIGADAPGMIRKTHQRLASDLGSVREMVSRVLREWTDLGHVVLRRAQVAIADHPALAAVRAG